jgi:Cytochrome b5-like Heme/Steroid binding domain
VQEITAVRFKATYHQITVLELDQLASAIMAGDGAVTAEDLAKHTAEDDCWLTIHGKVYNVTKYLVDHPGGMDVMMEHAGAATVHILASQLASRQHWPFAARELQRLRACISCSRRLLLQMIGIITKARVTFVASWHNPMPTQCS